MKHIYSYLWIAPLFILLQVFFLNNVQFVSYINPLVYLILIITLPQDTEKWFLIIYAFYAKFVGIAIPGSSGILIAISFFSGSILASVGIIGIYIARIYEQTQGRPRYIIKEIINPEKK